ncbi:hypothetical protein H4I96_06742 [Botrytis cinerea]
MEGATFSPERSQPNDQKSEGISINAITTAPDQLSPRESINGGEVAAFPDSEDWEIVGYLDKNQIEQINGLDPNSDPDTLKAHKEIEWPALYFKTFTCFSRLPLELRLDRLVFDSLEKSLEILSSIGITLNLSAFRNIAITQYSEQGNRSVVSESTWKAIEDNFPRLTSVNFCGNFAGAHVGRLPMRIPTLTRFHPLTQDTIGEVNRQTLYQDSHGLITPNAWIVNAHHMNVIARAAYKTKRSFLERSNTHGNYWKGVDFTISLWMEHTLHRAKDYIQLQPRRPIEGDQDNTYYTQAVGSLDIGSAYLKRSGGTSVIGCYADGTLFNSETAMKKDQLHGTHEGGKSKYLTWPWNCPSSDNGDSYDNSRFKNQVFRAL